jgi:hypothetical protein
MMPPTRRFAADTTVPESRSRIEVETTLARYGATAFGYAYDQGRNMAAIMFEVDGRRVRIHLPLPDPDDVQFKKVHRNQHSWEWATPKQARDRWAQACRQSWRALALIVKAKLEAVTAKITTVEQEFLAHIVLPDGSTVGDWVRPQIAAVYETGTMPELLPGPPPRKEEP